MNIKEAEARGYRKAEKHYQAVIAQKNAEIAQLNRSKGAAKSLIKGLKAELKSKTTTEPV